MDFINNIFTWIYEKWFYYEDYRELLSIVFESKDFAVIGFGLFLVSLTVLFAFYKAIDPVESQRLKWWAALIINSLLSFGLTYLILYNNQGLLTAITNYDGNGVDPEYFIFRISCISFLYAFILAILLCIFQLPVRFFSTNNTKLKII
ncbi:hypothetical protein [Jiulongibacter sediminis]|uniref:hypothetical protein n=1 Tax=Jiulongibacter sediminis TaxID=1605367 RepID=UPI0026F10074|nr:hypothetical protein [Jiulongibacter sediminis]